MIWHNINILLGIVAVFSLAVRVSDKVSMPKVLTESSFFVYGVHAMVVLLFSKLAQRFLPQSDMLMTIAYLIVPVVCAALCVLVYGGNEEGDAKIGWCIDRRALMGYMRLLTVD